MQYQKLLNHLGLFAFASLVWLLLIYKLGYYFGSGDHVELLPLVLKKVNPELYSNDFFVQGITAFQPNERTIFTLLLLPFSFNLEWACLIGHFLSTMLLVSGFWMLFRHFKVSALLSGVLLILALVWLYGRTLGGVELYYNTFQASSLAKGIGIWAIVLWLRKKPMLAFILIGLMTLIQITAGLSLGIPMALAHLSLEYKKKGISDLYPVLVYAAIALPFLISIVLARQFDGSYNQEEYFQILFKVRHPHHFLLSNHSPRRIALVALFFMVGLVGLKRRSPKLSLLLAFMGLLLIVYLILFETLRSPFLAGFQLMKTTIWFKPLAFLSLGIGLQQILPKFKSLNRRAQLLGLGILLLMNAAFMSWMIQNPNERGFYERHWFEQYRQNSEVDISIKAKEILPSDALIVQPFSFSAHKYFGEVSSWVDFKANVRHPAAVEEWFRRVAYLYGIKHEQAGFPAQKSADKCFRNLALKDINYLKSVGVTHLITFSGSVPPGCKLLYSNADYVICAL